jgi:lipopolysaccharide/colanic/teichoic acid biosynthesis glycosyltransferase
MTLIFFIIWIKIGFPIYTQHRPGLDNKLFKIYKFKTLYSYSDNIDISKRQNKVGDFLRKTGLDELPQLFNVLGNTMSLVGPRPLLKEYLDKYSEYEAQRHFAKPGITGLAQVVISKDGLKSWKKSIKLDIFYVYHVNFFLDLKILWRTLKIIILKKKNYQDFKKPF